MAKLHEKNENSTVKQLKNKKRLQKIKKQKKRKRVIIIFMVLLLSIILAIIILINLFVRSLGDNNLKGGIEPESGQCLNILLLGTDTGDKNSDLKRTDTIIVFNYNINTQKINLVSVPRDSLIEVQAYDGNGLLRDYWKINSAYALGGEEEVVKNVEKILDININYVFNINYEAFSKFIDTIGGINLYIEQDMYYDDETQDLHINFKKGETVLLDGKMAEEYFRWRKNNDGTGGEEGDLGRIKNQQKFIGKVIEKCLKPSIIFHIPELLDIIKEDILTNMPYKSILKYGIKTVSNKGISMNTLYGYPEVIYDEDFLIVNKEDNEDIIKALKSNNKKALNKEDYKILILNGTDITGLAANYKVKMKQLGYTKIEIDNTDYSEKSLIITKDINLKDLLEKDLAIENYNKEILDKYLGYDAVIILGENIEL